MAPFLLLLACDARARRERMDAEDASAQGPTTDADVPFTCLALRGSEALTPGQRCDGTPDCLEGLDEIDCPGQFVCPEVGGSGPPRVIDEALVCDGTAQCYHADDERDCPHLQQTLCESGDEGSFIVYRPDQRCDGQAQCFRADDEQACPDSLICPTTNFGQQIAIPTSRVCDGVWDCSIDEFDCPDVVDPFTCPDGKTIDRKFMCDKAEDCAANGGTFADEADPSCHQYRCRRPVVEGEDRDSCPSCYIHEDKVCDGVRDCREGDDERDCP